MGLFYIFFLVIGVFFILNLFVGVVIDKFNEMKEKAEGVSVFLTGEQFLRSRGPTVGMPCSSRRC